MQKAILVTDATTGAMLEKCVYSGDTSDPVMQKYVAGLLARYPTATIVTYDTDTDPAFVGAK